MLKYVEVYRSEPEYAKYARVCKSIPKYAKVLQYFIDDVDLVLDDTLNQVVHVFNAHADESLSVND